MWARRRRGGPPVSFFAFQDIITGLAGAMVVIVLLMAFFRTGRGGAELGGGVLADAAAEERLRARLSLCETELASARAAQAAFRRRVAEAARSERDRRRAAQLAAARSELELETRRRQAELSGLEAELRALAAADAAATAAAGAAGREFQALRTALADKERALADAERRFKVRSAEGGRTFAVLDCGRSRWRWQMPDAPVRELGAADAPTPAAALAALRTQLRNLDPTRHTLLVAVRPSAGGFIDALLEVIQESAPRLEIAVEPLASETLGGFTP